MKTTKERCDSIEQKLYDERKRTSGRRAKLIAALSCAAALVLTLSLVLFLPYPSQNIAKYRDSEYYSLICKIDGLRPKREYNNNFELIASGIADLFSGYGAKGDATEAPTTPDRYEEVTNNQVQGVIEGDLFKRSDKNIYYLTCNENSYSLDVYPVAGAETKKAASLKISPDKNMYFSGYAAARELYLNQTATQALIVTPSYNSKEGLLYTAVIGIDLTGEAPKETGRVYVSGSYVSSRLVDGALLLVSNFRINNFDYDDEKQFVPQTGAYGKMESLPADDLIVPEEATGTRYTVLCAVDTANLTVADSLSFLSYSEEVYVSENAVYTTLSYYPEKQSGNDYGRRTKISRVEYGERLALSGTTEVTGVINDRFGMDEHEGVLRVFTTTFPDGRSNASLYCINLSDYSLRAAVENFAPEGESVYGTRFRESKAYVCTAVELRDPVFAFDLSDYDDIAYTHTGTISGYSLFLTPFKDGTMLGIGVGDSRSSLKIELYEESGSEVISVAKFEDDVGVGFSEEFKSYYINAEQGMIGIATKNYYTNQVTYCVWQFDGYGLNLIKTFALQSDNGVYEERAVLIEGIFYLFCPASGLQLWDMG